MARELEAVRDAALRTTAALAALQQHAAHEPERADCAAREAGAARPQASQEHCRGVLPRAATAPRACGPGGEWSACGGSGGGGACGSAGDEAELYEGGRPGSEGPASQEQGAGARLPHGAFRRPRRVIHGLPREWLDAAAAAGEAAAAGGRELNSSGRSSLDETGLAQ
jgi:hypothetical protein